MGISEKKGSRQRVGKQTTFAEKGGARPAGTVIRATPVRQNTKGLVCLYMAYGELAQVGVLTVLANQAGGGGLSAENTHNVPNWC